MIPDSPPHPGQGLVGGVDGVRGGAWVMAVTATANLSPVREFSVWRSFSDLWSHAREQGLLFVAVDIPIGLPTRSGRASDYEARLMLKGDPGRASSVFPAPPICTLAAADYQQALRLAKQHGGKGLSSQAFALLPKIREVRDSLMDVQDALPRVVEVHPEVSFGSMAGGPMRFHKSYQPGVVERLAVLGRHFPNIVEAALLRGITTRPVSGEEGRKPLAPGLDDVLDAAAAAWTARRLALGRARRLGGSAEDENGFPMSIWV